MRIKSHPQTLSLMEHLFGRFSLGTILRHFVCGLIFVGTVFWCRPEWARELAARKDFVHIVLLIALPAGMLIYGISRSLFGAIVEFMRDCVVCECCCFCKAIFPEQCRHFLERRWNARACVAAEQGERNKKINDLIEAWADYAHLLYTSGLAVLFGYLASVADFATRQKFNKIEFDFFGLAVCVFLLISGFISDIRKRIAEDMFYHHVETQIKQRKMDVRKKIKGMCFFVVSPLLLIMMPMIVALVIVWILLWVVTKILNAIMGLA